MDRLGRSPLGRGLIDFLGHMGAPTDIEQRAFGRQFPGPVWLGAGLNAGPNAVRSFAHFGFGAIEVGPVSVDPATPIGQTLLLPDQLALSYGPGACTRRAEDFVREWGGASNPGVPIAVRIAAPASSDLEAVSETVSAVIAAIAPLRAIVIVEAAPGFRPIEQWQTYFEKVRLAAGTASHKLSVCLCLPCSIASEDATALWRLAEQSGFEGIAITAGSVDRAGNRLTGSPTRDASLVLVRALRAEIPPDIPIIAAGGIMAPADAIEMRAAGATFVQIHSGFVYSGPGLPKRINEAVLTRLAWGEHNRDSDPEGANPGQADGTPTPYPGSKRAYAAANWRSGVLLGVGMVVSGVLAWAVAATRVILPYDEHFLGITRAQVNAINCCLLHFMEHDRITLSGTMISIGVLYWFLSRRGMASGAHWAWKAMVVSGGVGFASFFLFLVYGYFDPLHALASLVLFPFFVSAIWKKPKGLGLEPATTSAPAASLPGMRNDRSWRMGLWGQLLFVLIGFGLCLAGITIAVLGGTRVFVPTDLAYLHTTAAAIRAANPRLIPLIAHDRAGFGGALLSDGVCVLLTALWGYRAGVRWVWWMLLLGGLPGFIAAIGVHMHIGYMAFVHLAPVYAAIIMYVAGLTLSRPFLWGVPQEGSARS